MPMGIVLPSPVSALSIISRLEPLSPTFISLSSALERNGQHSCLRSDSRDCNNVGRRFSYCDAIQDLAVCPIDLVNPLTKPVAIVNRAESKVRPHVMRVIPHPVGAFAIDLSLDPECRRVYHRDRARLDAPFTSRWLATRSNCVSTQTSPTPAILGIT